VTLSADAPPAQFIGVYLTTEVGGNKPKRVYGKATAIVAACAGRSLMKNG